jgi:CubicO group peptidase (beta-lactamase class C family)
MPPQARSQINRTLLNRTLPARPSLRHLKLEAKRRLAAAEFATLHDAQAAIAREHGLPGWAALKQACAADNPALAHVHWIVERFRDAGTPGWTAPGDDELRQHFDDVLLAVIPAGSLTETFTKNAAELRAELSVIRQGPFEAQVQLAGVRYVAVVTPEPPHRLIGLRGFALADRITDPRMKEPPPVRVAGKPPDGVAAMATAACADLGLPAVLLAGGEPGRPPWTVAAGHASLEGASLEGASLEGAEPLQPGHQFPVPGVTGLVTMTAVLRLVAEGHLALDAPANERLRTVRLADASVTVRELLSHTSGVDSPTEFYAGTVPDLAELMGPVIGCGGPRGTVWPSNGGYAVLGQLIADVTGTPYAQAATRLVLRPLGMRDSRFPDTAADIPRAANADSGAGPGAVTGYTVTLDGAFEPWPAQVSTIQAIAGLWATGADLVRLGLGWPSLLPAALARQAVTQQAEPGPAGVRVGLGLLLDGGTAADAGSGLDAVALLRTRLRDRRTFVVLTSRAAAVDSLDERLRHIWL